MRIGPTWGLTLPLLLSLSALTPVLGERTAQEIVLDANRFLSEGQYTSAARAYGEAIGMSRNPPITVPLCSSDIATK